MTRQTATITREAADALASTPAEELLHKAFLLTHKMHGAIARGDEGLEADLRAARDLITAEVLRRTGDQS